MQVPSRQWVRFGSAEGVRENRNDHSRFSGTSLIMQLWRMWELPSFSLRSGWLVPDRREKDRDREFWMRRGITLVETMIVISIITILSVVLWLVLGPQAKRGGLETEIRGDLRQLSIALQLYNGCERWGSSLLHKPPVFGKSWRSSQASSL